MQQTKQLLTLNRSEDVSELELIYKVNLDNVKLRLTKKADQQAFDWDKKYNLGIRDNLIASILNKLDKPINDIFTDFSIYLELYRFLYVEMVNRKDKQIHQIRENFLCSFIKQDKFKVDDLVKADIVYNSTLAYYIKDQQMKLKMYEICILAFSKLHFSDAEHSKEKDKRTTEFEQYVKSLK